MFADVFDEFSPENGDDELEEVDPASLPAPRQRGRVKCDQCQMQCRNNYLLEKHIKARHGNQEQPGSNKSCPYCGKVFKGTATRALHMTQCSLQPRSQCECNGACNCASAASTSSPSQELPGSSTTATTRARLRSDIINELESCSLNPVSFSCEDCNKKFVSDANLRRHKIKYHGG